MTQPSSAAMRGDESFPVTYEAVLATVRSLLADLLKAEPADILATSTPIDLGADSICLTKLGFQLERQYGIKIAREFTIPDEFTIEALARRLASDVAARTA